MRISQVGFAMFNVCSLMGKIDELNNLTSVIRMDLLGVTETWIQDELKGLPGYVGHLARPLNFANMNDLR